MGSRWIPLTILSIGAVALVAAIISISVGENRVESYRIEEAGEVQQLIAGIRQLGDRLGPEDAPITIDVFTDVQIPTGAAYQARRRRPADRGVRANRRGEHDPAALPAGPEAGDRGRDRVRGGGLSGPPVAVRRALHAEPRARSRAGHHRGLPERGRRRRPEARRDPVGGRSRGGRGGGARGRGRGDRGDAALLLGARDRGHGRRRNGESSRTARRSSEVEEAIATVG